MLSSRAKFVSAFTSALIERRIVPHFQPIVQLSDDTVIGFEVLARWHEAEYGDVSPAEFIPFAETCHLLDDLLEGLMTQAMNAAKAWPDRLFLAFNVSPNQLHNPMLYEHIARTAATCGFPLSRVHIEVVETAALGVAEEVAAQLARLRDEGCTIVADDFGTGYSSLTWLRTLPFSKIKIDTSFVRSMPEERESRKIVNAVIALGQSLGFAVVAEGIETPAQADLLRHMGCAFGQGYLFSRAVPAGQVPALLAAMVPANHSADLERLSLERRGAQISSFYASPAMSVCFLDLDYRVVKANEVFAQHLGKSLAEVHGQAIGAIIPDSMNRLKELRAFRLAGLPYPPIEVELPGGRTDLVITQQVCDEAGDLLGYSLLGIDITDQKAAEKALRESVAQLRFLMERGPHMLWVANAEGEIEDFNPRLGELVGISLADTLHRGWLTCVDPEHRDAMRAQFDRAIGAGTEVDLHFRLQRPDGSWTWVRAWGAPQRDEAGTVLRWYGTVTAVQPPGAPGLPAPRAAAVEGGDTHEPS